ncbi:trypco2 family protein [Streptomyces sp. NBC_00344]|uniref:trypco2 family protein n=1 Tax=Streptomyces sp. NBC_00344 TaxID=2975720 RepID=UPI002E22D3E7
MENGTDEPSGVGLAELISQVRAELEEAQQRIGGSRLRLGVQKVGLEVTVQVTREFGGSGKLRLGVVTAGGSGSLTRENTHRINVELAILDEEDRPKWIDVKRKDGPGVPPAG